MSASSNTSSSSSSTSPQITADIMNFLPLTAPITGPSYPQERLTKFLILSPVSSPSYPMSPPLSTPRIESGIQLPVSLSPPTKSAPTSAEIQAALKVRRSSSCSVSSTGSAKLRFLKLGPVYWGGQAGVGDYADEE